MLNFISQNKFVILIAIGIFVVPISAIAQIGGQPMWFPHYLALLFMMFLGAAFVLWDFDKILSIFIIICVCSTFFVSKIHPRAVMLLIQLILCCLIAYGVSKFNSIQRRGVLLAIFGLFLLQAVWVILQHLNLDPLFNSIANPTVDAIGGFSGSADQIGTFFALTLPIVLYLCPVLAIFSLIGIYLSKSSFALVSGIVAGLFYLYYKSKKLFGVCLLLSILVATIFFTKAETLTVQDFKVRFTVWKYSSLAVINKEINVTFRNVNVKVKCNPWIGYGFGNYRMIFPYMPQIEGINCVDEKFTHAHNDYVENLFELGYIGSLALFLLIVSVFVRFYKSHKSEEGVLYFSCILAYMMNATGNFLSQIAISGMLLTLFFGLFRGVLNEK